MAIKRRASANWKGDGMTGKGTLNTSNRFFSDTPYSFKARFENEDGVLGTNPEELIGAAHAGCYAMALSFGIAGAGFKADNLDVTATVTLDEGAITSIVLSLDGHVAGMSETQFTELANGAKAGCPISKALAAVPISLDIKFQG